MKTPQFTITAVALIAFSSVVSTAFSQGRPSGALGGRPANAQRPTNGSHPAAAPGDASAAITHLTEAFAKIAPFDEDRDGRLSALEWESIARAIADGSVQAPAHRSPPPEVTVPREWVFSRIAGMYATLAPYDGNRDGVLDESEQAELRAAIESGKVGRPGGPPGGRQRR